MRGRRAWLLMVQAFTCVATRASCHSQDGPYLLSSHTCQAVFDESSDADFACLVDDKICSNTTLATLSWYFVSPVFHFGIPLADGDKYGVWQSSYPAARRSSLRVRDVIKDADVGLVECVASCGGDSGSGGDSQVSVLRQSVDVCVINTPTGLAFCSSSPADGRCLSAFGGAVCEKICDSEENHYGGGNCRRRPPPDAGVAPAIDLSGNHGANGSEAGRCSGSCGRCGGNACRPKSGDDATARAGAAAAWKGAERCYLVVLIATSDDGELARDGRPAVGAASVQSSLASELNTSLCVVGQSANWSLSEPGGLVLYYFNRSLFVGADGSRRRFEELQFALSPDSCQPGAFCFSDVDNAAKYLANRLMLSRHASWGANVAGIGVPGLKGKCATRYRAEELDPDLQPLPGTQMQLQPIDIASIVGLSLGVAAGLVLVTGLSYTIVCWHRTFKKKPPEAPEVEESRHAVGCNSQPLSLSTSGGTESEESQALLSKALIGRPPELPNAPPPEAAAESSFAATAC